MATEIHKTVEYFMPIRVDEKVLPLVAVLNGHPDIETRASCQGNLLSEYETRADVMFLATRAAVFAIIEALQEHLGIICNWEIQIHGGGGYDLYVPQQDIEAVAAVIRAEVVEGRHDRLKNGSSSEGEGASPSLGIPDLEK